MEEELTIARARRSVENALVRRAALLVLALALLAAPAGCVSYQVVRASSLNHLTAAESTIRVTNVPAGAIADLTRQTFADRGYPLVLRRQVSGQVTLLVFTGPRRAVTTGGGTSDMVVAQTNEIGSWFVARIVELRGFVEVSMFGQPTVNGQEVCADADAYLREAEYWCLDTRMRTDYPYAWMLTGKEESEVVHGVQATLQQQLSGRP
jgi:hypothetical protein